MSQSGRKKLIEVALPLEAINEGSALEKQPFTRRHPRSIHIWWARRPFVAARAIIFAQMVDDPSSWPDLFPTEKAQEKERQRLFRIIEDLVRWENTTNQEVLQKARDEIWRSWRRACAENIDHPRAKEIFDRDRLPGFHDPFAGGGALPVEAQRLGLISYASDLNPVAVLINKAMIEIPSRFTGRPPVNPDARVKIPLNTWEGSQGLAQDLRYYGQWIQDEAEKRIGHLYPKVDVTAQMAVSRPDLKPYVGKKLAVIGWIWARTVRSPNPAFSTIEVPLASSFMLSTKEGKEAYVAPKRESGSYSFSVKLGEPDDPDQARAGTKLSRGNFACLMSGAPISGDYIKSEGMAGRIGSRLMAIVAEGNRERIYLDPTPEMEAAAVTAEAAWEPTGDVPSRLTGGTCVPYGLTKWSDLFTSRQLVALTTFTDLIKEARSQVHLDAVNAGIPDDGKRFTDGGTASDAYADAIATYLALATSRWADMSNTICTWNQTNQNVRALFSRQAIPMTWDYVELSPFSTVGPWISAVESSVEASVSLPSSPAGAAFQKDATKQDLSADKVVSTDPPYYDNIGYADLSEFFYAWLRPSMRDVFPSLFSTITVPKAEELVATSYRHGGRESAERFFLEGMTAAMKRLSEQAHPAFPVTIYYAFKQSETQSSGTASTGWETFLEAVLKAGFALTGTWPVRTERAARSVAMDTNALASSIILVCRQRALTAPNVTRRDFLNALEKELPRAIADLQRGNVAPVDLQQAAIGPGMAIFTRYSSVLDADGKPLSVRAALTMINQALDEVLAKQEGDFDGDTRWALTWFEQYGFSEGEYGVAETLATARNTSVQGIVDAGIGVSGRGRVRLLKPDELPADWTPEGDKRLTVWDMVHHLIRILDQGETPAAELLARLGTRAEVARELAYRLYSICDRTKRSQDAQRYNALVQSWPEIALIAQQIPKQAHEKQQSFEGMN